MASLGCPLTPPLPNTCDAGEASLWSFKNGSYFADSHGFGAEYRTELRSFLGKNGANSWVLWTVVLPATFLLCILAHLAVKRIFGRLRMSERQHIRERLWNYAFYKFIFVFGVVNVESVEEMIIWLDWFVILGYIHFLIVLSRDRCEYMTFSPVSVNTAHTRLITLLGGIIAASVSILGCSGFLLSMGFLHTGLFVAAEGLLVFFPTCHILLRYGFHHLRQGRSAAKWEQQTGLHYYLNLLCDAGNLVLDLCHHVHMILQVFNVSACSIVIVAQIRFLSQELNNKFRKHRNFTAIQKRLQAAFPRAMPEEIEKHDGPCSICWDTLEQARKLHCGHLFHESCLLSWLEQDISCPICRVSLSDTFDLRDQRQNANRLISDEGARFFTFEGSRLNRWLPNVSVTVSHPLYEYLETSDIEMMAEQVRQVFPNVPQHDIIQDLLETGSAETTIDNILAGSLDATPPFVSMGITNTGPETERLNSVSAPAVVPDSAEGCRALQAQRKEAMLREARKNFIARLAKEKAQKLSSTVQPSRLQENELSPG
ncbi:E3 ubiquitin-protein ligase AMFR [Hypsibius exemplaris]|uniref:E3 ubiquitin-protein ligase AMFR n=1 Tax=Hypsibius exemplaris TaxID=2072580 RepID=A0A1W0WHS2_HYPEX|nr:E3 ubiquitin-protein ligase AMFR [Hypsibius exemplaris]